MNPLRLFKGARAEFSLRPCYGITISLYLHALDHHWVWRWLPQFDRGRDRWSVSWFDITLLVKDTRRD